MTVVAYRNGVLAADSRCVYGGNEIDSDQCVKITKTKDGRLLAACGSSALGDTYMKSLQGLADKPTMGEGDGRVIEIIRGEIVIHEKGGSYSLGKLKFGAWGSGSGIAKGAMHMGASARKAVAIAIKEDIGCGGKIRTLKEGKVSK